VACQTAMTTPNAFARSAAPKLGAAQLVAWFAVTCGLLLLMGALSVYRERVKDFECAHARLDSGSLSRLFSAADVTEPESAAWEAWAEQHHVTISWSITSGTFDDRTITSLGTTTAGSVTVPACGVSVHRDSYALRPSVLHDTSVEVTAGIFLAGLGALGVLRLLRERKRAPDA